MDSSSFVGAILAGIDFHVRRYWIHWCFLIVGVLSCGYAVYLALFAPPTDFPVGQLVSVSSGETASEVAHTLALDHVILHPRVLYALIRLSGGTVHAGVYKFASPLSTLAIAERLMSGDTGVSDIRITFPEGETARQMASAVAKVFPEVSMSDFIAAGEPYEGYLFPDTYNFLPDATAGTITAQMRATFTSRVSPLQSQINASGHTLSDIITMASIIEKEARTPADKHIVSGILWHRIALGMPLQVDAVFGYIESKPTFSPSLDELTIDSPYNTYTHKGLPPGPIDNPGLDSIEAALTPTKTPYLYYLTGSDGNMYYATTFAEHKANRAKYLN